jgi:hypothetical protein
MARLYADEDFSYPVIQRLRQLGHNILMAHEAGQASQGIEDAVVLACVQVCRSSRVSLWIVREDTIPLPSTHERLGASDARNARRRSTTGLDRVALLARHASHSSSCRLR